MNTVNWLNQNQGFVMAILTMVYVVTTIIIALLTLKATNLSRKNLETTIEIEKNRLRPYVIFNISSSTIKKNTFASVKNLGLSAAYNIKLSITPKLTHSFDTKLECAFTSADILFLPPNEEIIDVLGTSPSFHQQYTEPSFQGFVEYEDSLSNKYKEPFRIDLTYLKKRIYVEDENVIDELKTLNQTLLKISKGFEE